MVAERIVLVPDWLSALPLHIKGPLVLAAAPVVILALAVAWFVGLALYRVFGLHVLRTDIYSAIPRPPHKSKYFALFGDLPEIRRAPPADAHIAWERELKSSVYVYRALFYQPRVILADPKALNHILGQANSYSYPKPEGARNFLIDLLGNGLLVAEGDDHRRQRKIIQPSFNVSAIRDLTPLFFRHANDFAAKLAELVDGTKGPAEAPFLEGQSAKMAQVSQPSKPVMEVSSWLSRVTLDIIGDAGFDHQFESVKRNVEDMDDAIYSSFQRMMKMLVDMSLLDFLRIALSRVPGLAWVNRLPSRRRDALHTAKKALNSTGLRIVERKRKEIIGEAAAVGVTLGNGGQIQGNGHANGDAKIAAMTNAEKAFFGEEEQGKSKDLLYLMMKANMAPNVRESERMNDAELLGQITTLLTAGHETTSTLTTWFLHVVSQPGHQHVQKKLRAEVEEYFIGRDDLDYDVLMGMPYLDMVTKEILRLLAPVTNTERVALRDDVVPLSKPYKTRDGKGTFDSVPIQKGLMLIIPIQMINRSADIWGDDADEFKPERWENVPRAAKQTGFPLSILSFIEGPRGCIGNRFALAEFKAIVCALVRTLHFESVGWEVERKQGIVIRPRVVGQEKEGTQMPLRVSRVAAT